jgi:hypothetical protein
MATCHIIFQFGCQSTSYLDRKPALEANGRLGGQDIRDLLEPEVPLLFSQNSFTGSYSELL